MHPAYPPNSSLPEAGPPIQPPEPSKELLQRIEGIERKLKEIEAKLEGLSYAYSRHTHTSYEGYGNTSRPN